MPLSISLHPHTVNNYLFIHRRASFHWEEKMSKLFMATKPLLPAHGLEKTYALSFSFVVCFYLIPKESCM